jgi:uncharacterized protein (DUF362 family)
LLVGALERSGFWALLAARCHETGRAPGDLRIVVKPDLGAFRAGSPAATDPALVEALIDLLHDRAYGNVAVVASTDSSSAWAENRDVLSLAELLGYAFTTPAGRSYEIADLGEDLAPVAFPPGALLHGSSLSRAWADADVRLLFAKNRTDEVEGYALTLDSLIGVLPLADKDYFYRQRCDPGTLVLELLSSVPPHFALVDAVVSGHGSGGARAPRPLDTHTIIASRSPVLADFVAGLKMGVDPSISRLTAAALRSGRLPPRYQLDGNLGVYAGWQPVNPIALDAVRRRHAWVAVSRTLSPWLQQIDAASFPHKQPADAQIHEAVASRFADLDGDGGALALYALVNYALGWLFDGVNGYQMLHDKDRVRRRHVPLGFDPAAYAPADYEGILPELLQLRETLRDQPFDNNGLRWRYVNEAVIFEISYLFPVPFEEFVAAIDVARTIQFMNDYLGGVVVPVAHDALGRVTHQAERNLYLPQPNYLVLSQGAVIDVEKLEHVEYADGLHRMSWKTIRSENGSAQYDDGVVAFSREEASTRATIFGRQLFALPPFWKAVNLDLAPALKQELVTHAYTTFFLRTFANFEALLEGRPIAIGRAWPDETAEPLLAETLAAKIAVLLERHGPLLSRAWRAVPRPDPLRVDALGFSHFSAAAADPRAGLTPEEAAAGEAFSRGWSEFWTGLSDALRRDASAPPGVR